MPRPNPTALKPAQRRTSRYRTDPFPNLIRPATREETLPVALAATVLAFIALLLCVSKNYLLLYGDAVAHLGIARRILDNRNPTLQQFGGVWLPLPHLVMLPFVQNIAWWQNGLAGAFPSMLFYILGVAGFYRLSRRLLVPRWAFAATAFFALNPNLLYLATTAMTEPLFLALLIWLTLLTLEAVAAIRAREPRVGPRLILISLLILAAVYTRYDGWILVAVIWLILAWHLTRDRDLLRRNSAAFAAFTLITLFGPVSWLAFNAHYFHDPLDFLRGPYSAYAIDVRTRPGAQHHRGWHNPAWSLLFYTRTAQVDSTAWELGFLTMAAALAGLVLLLRRAAAFIRGASLVTRDAALPTHPDKPYGREILATLLLWLPLPFYVYSISWGSIPIFIPNLWPHAFYNSRYGLELLPALALFATLALAALETFLAVKRPIPARLLQPVTLALIAINSVVMMYTIPLVLNEAKHNSTTRIPFESAIARQLETFPPHVPILMYNSDHVGALEEAGIPLKQTINEGDYDSFHAALAAPAQHAAYVIAIAGDPVSQAVAQHPENLTELVVLCTSGQPCARVYQSDIYKP